jgi:pilus biogenesis lipoprotein CpaD
MQTVRTMIAESRCGIAGLAVRAVIVAGYALLVCGCNTDQQQITSGPDVPTDYRLRHPITISESDHTLEVFIGSNRGSLSATQRAELLEFAQTWKQEATGGVLIDLPTGTVNEGAAAAALHEIQSILAATGVPPKSMMAETIRPTRARRRPSASPIRKSPHKPDPVVCGPRISGQASTANTSKISLPGTLAAPANATSRRWSKTRPTSCSHAARRRPIRCGAPRS